MMQEALNQPKRGLLRKDVSIILRIMRLPFKESNHLVQNIDWKITVFLLLEIIIKKNLY